MIIDKGLTKPIREPELDQYRSIWLTKEGYTLLRKEKRKQKISMAKIICNLILKEYGKPRTTKPISTKTD